jgi:2-polyprenyl-3-methyl-5-hydroxy-6-metoxy-1,4-benzoquinol methylase
MNINRLRRHWDALGKTDPLWANLTNEDKRGGKWDADEFFLTGEQEIEEVMDFVGSLSVTFEHGRALDFGCGVGRLTQALAARFDDVWGVDIAPSMIEAANRYNRHPGRCHYYLNDRTDLGRFDDASFDFIYSNIVLQHMQPRDQRRNLAELVRVSSNSRASRSRCPTQRVVGRDSRDASSPSPRRSSLSRTGACVER